MVHAGLIRKQITSFLNGEALYSITGRGIQALEQLGVHYLGANLEREKEAHEFQIPHALELNSIRIALMRTPEFGRWTPECYIRVLSLSPATAYAKIYDAIVRVHLIGDSIEVAIEYERTLKSQAKYEKIRDAIESEKRLNVFLYLVPDFELLYSLSNIFQGTKRLVYFGLTREFKKQVFEAPFRTDIRKERSLREILTDAIVAAAARH
jgi:hypothetical protein